jgi:cytochrome c-type biogenesis protein CcmE
MTRRQRRLILVGISLAVLGLAAALALSALRESIVFFYSPTEIAEKNIAPGARIRIGGLVKEASVQKSGLDARFEVTDGAKSLAVTYKGVLPDLFREKQGVIAEGALDASGVFRADTVLAKHDENYMPKEVADALKKQGHWHEDKGKAK